MLKGLGCRGLIRIAVTDANTSYQREVGEYLSRFDEYLRKVSFTRHCAHYAARLSSTLFKGSGKPKARLAHDD